MSPREFIGEYAPAGAWDAIEREKRRIYPGMLHSENIQLTAGLATFLAQARDAAVRTAIVSSSSRDSVDAILQALWTAPAPAAIVARGDALAAKPDPAPYIAVLEQLRLPASCVVAFEDSASGIASATGAGLFCIQVGFGEQGGEARIVNFTDCTIEAGGEAGVLTVRDR
jgi:HAD superfamily hydrolase (TIGR01509 family)